MSGVQTGHPLPVPPGKQQYQQQQQQQQQYYQQRPPTRTRSKSNFSFRSQKSHDSSGSAPKVDLHETPREKASRRLSTKADPRLAMSEAEPSAVASGIASKLAPLRAIQHRDANGLPIADPDRSNPTRSRWERPLDTIRSFEAAIDGNYTRKSYMRTESADSVSPLGRRTSYFAGSHNNGGGMGPRYPQEGYYGGRGSSFRPDSYVDNRGNNGMSRPDSYYDNNGKNGPSNGYYPSRARYPRNASEPQYMNGAGVYPPHGNQQSYETVTNASGSGSSGEPLGYSTDPSSENSSLDRIQVPPKGDLAEQHGYFNGPGIGSQIQMQPQNFGSGGYGGPGGNHQEMPTVSGGYSGRNNGPPQVPRKESGPPRVPIKLGTPAGDSAAYDHSRPGAAEKRKSWFGKRFSRA